MPNRIGLALVAASGTVVLAGCGGHLIYHPDPCRPSPLFRDDVVVFGLPPDGDLPAAARGAPVDCHYRKIGSETVTTVRMELALFPHDQRIYAAQVPGVSKGEVEYYFTFTNSNRDRARMPESGFLRCGARPRTSSP